MASLITINCIWASYNRDVLPIYLDQQNFCSKPLKNWGHKWLNSLLGSFHLVLILYVVSMWPDALQADCELTGSFLSLTESFRIVRWILNNGALTNRKGRLRDVIKTRREASRMSQCLGFLVNPSSSWPLAVRQSRIGFTDQISLWRGETVC